MPVSPGSRLGPYEVVELLGAGGMGEVYRAFDPRLGREVAVKVLPSQVAANPERLLRFEREARAIASLSHPNILTVFDVGTGCGLEEEAGTAVPYVVTELLHGETLREIASHRALSPTQVLDFAVQIAHGLHAAHTKGIVHRDVKPENVIVTTDGRVKVLDFGLAKLVDLAGRHDETTTASPTGADRVIGTAGYMSPEQVRGLPLDQRTDVFSLGVLLYELLSGRHPFRRDTTPATLCAILEETPGELSYVNRAVPPALSRIVRRCLEKDREQRFHSAHDLALSLEAALAVHAGSTSPQGIEEKSPYPGLASFTEKDVACFFGRETEVAALWAKLRARTLLAVIGPSGAGKTSLVRAGLVASRPQGWNAIVCTPGAAPFRGLGRGLVPELSGDADVLGELVDIDDPAVAFNLLSRWRKAHDAVLLVVDQFEELFTLSPAEVQERFAGLLGRLAAEADVHVLLSLRDDFLIRCSEHVALAPVFRDLTPLSALGPEALGRALVEPARQRGYRFEDDAMVAGMVASVQGARGALPLLAFAVSRLWEKRDLEKQLLTRAAYAEIGGVSGALAQHAEATLARIGAERHAIVREILRNLVTSHGTRAVAEREDLLSLFPERRATEDVLRELIDARLLTSYELASVHAAAAARPADDPTATEPADAGEQERPGIEIVHESLLKAWPRLLRWQAQDEEGALLRDQLRQAAHLWKEKARPSDLLWSGTSFREYELWRERYSGKLTALEEQFARAMTDRARRLRRLRQAAVAAVVVGLGTVAVAVSVLRHQAVLQAERAAQQAQLAQASKVVALGRNQIDAYPTAALAYARKSLEVADTVEARHLALEALWRGPTVRVLPMTGAQHWFPAFSPDGNWLATGGMEEAVSLYRADGTLAHTIHGLEVTANPRSVRFDAASRRLVTGTWLGTRHRLFSVPEARELPSVATGPRTGVAAFDDTLLTWTIPEPGREIVWHEWRLDGRAPKTVARFGLAGVCSQPALDPRRRWIVYARGWSVFLHRLSGGGPDLLLGTHDQPMDENGPQCLALAPTGDRVASIDASREVRVWSLRPGETAPPRVLRGMGNLEDQSPALFDPGASRLAWGSSDERSVYLWDVDAPRDAEPVLLRRPDAQALRWSAFTPDGEWLAVMDGVAAMFWPVGARRSYVLHGHTRGPVTLLAFTADSRWLASSSFDGARLWPLASRGTSAYPNDRAQEGWVYGLATAPSGATVLVSGEAGRVNVVPIGGGPVRNLLGSTWGAHTAVTGAVAFDTTGRYAAWATGFAAEPADKVLRVWDLESGKQWVWPLCRSCDKAKPYDRGVTTLRFAPDGSLFSSAFGGVQRWRVETGESQLVLDAPVAFLDATPGGRHLLICTGDTSDVVGGEIRHVQARLMDVRDGTSQPITGRGDFQNAALDATGRILVTGHSDGSVRVAPVTGGEPHLLLGHAGPIAAVAVSPDGRWIASSSGTEIRLWPMPDVSRPPLQTLPYDVLMRKLQALTNLRVVDDPSSPSGYKLEVGPFPGWKDVPTW
jgi:WD40 repeat protein